MNHRPSSLPMLAECSQFVGNGGEFAEQGTVRHAALSDLLTGNDAGLFLLDTDEEREAVRWAADYIKLKAPTADYPFVCEVKRQWLGPDFTEREGTPDVVCGPVLFDFKWRRRSYDAQMADYALALMDDGFDVIEVHVLYGAVKQVEVIRFDRATANRIVAPILDKAGRNDPTPCDYCGWCANRLTCSALLERANVVAENRDDWRLESYHASEIVTADEMGKALKLAKALGDWVEAVEHYAKEMARNGVIPTGFKIQNRQGNRFITSVTEAYAKSGITQEEFLKACEIKFTSLVELHAAKEGIKKAAAEREMEKRLGDVVQRKSPSVSLVSIKEKD